MADFSNYELGDNVYELANGLLPEIAEAANFDLGEVPSELALRGLIGRLGPAKELQRNIAGVKDFLGENADGQAADWVERSGVLIPVERPFASPGLIPDSIDAIVWSGGVANWMLRRASLTERFDSTKTGKVVLALGTREMSSAEHPNLARHFARTKGFMPREADFANQYIVPRLESAGFTTKVVITDSKSGDTVLDQAFTEIPELQDGTMLVVGNAPNVIQAAGQIRLAAQRASYLFDSNGVQLFMASDTIPVARKGEGTATHQNPFSALGQIARNALYIHKTSIDF